MPRGVSVYDEARLQGRLWTPLVDAQQLALLEWWDSTFGIAPGSTAASWTGSYGGRTATGASGSQPTRILDAKGIPALLFSGSQQLLGAAPLLLPAGSEIFAVVRSNTASGNHRYFSQGQSGPEAVSGFYCRSNGAAYQSNIGNASDVASAVIPATFSMALDKVIVDSIGSSASTTTNGVNYRISGFSSGEYWSGSIYDIIPCGRVLPAFLKNKMLAFLAWKHGIPLPASNPFANRPPLIGD